MLLKFANMEDVDVPALMEIYAEGNRENGAYFYPDLPEAEGIARAEADFEAFLRETFFAKPGNVMYVLERAGEWAAALRLTPIEDFWYLEALETKPSLRKQGCALALLREVVETLGEDAVIRDCVNKKNLPSLVAHFAAGFRIETDPGVSYPDGTASDREYGMIYRKS